MACFHAFSEWLLVLQEEMGAVFVEKAPGNNKTRNTADIIFFSSSARLQNVLTKSQRPIFNDVLRFYETLIRHGVENFQRIKFFVPDTVHITFRIEGIVVFDVSL